MFVVFRSSLNDSIRDQALVQIDATLNNDLISVEIMRVNIKATSAHVYAGLFIVVKVGEKFSISGKL